MTVTYSPYWCKHLLACQNRGSDAYRAGVPRDQCPYEGRDNFSRQRAQYWRYGWDAIRDLDEHVGDIS